MKLKTLVIALIVAATLCAPGRSEAAAASETSQLLLPGISLVAGLIGGKVIGASMGIAAFGTAISGKVPGAIIGGLLSAALAAKVAPATMSLADALRIGITVVRLARVLKDCHVATRGQGLGIWTKDSGVGHNPELHHGCAGVAGEEVVRPLWRRDGRKRLHRHVHADGAGGRRPNRCQPVREGVKHGRAIPS